jgi:7-carboxy-7-deazaguanine synthase
LALNHDTLRIHEIFASIQGESTFAGLRCTFVRLTGCDLRCTWCDTTQAFRDGTELARSEVLARALALGTDLVEVTGGEPLLQPGTLPLMRELCDAGRTVLLETSGAHDISRVDERVHRIVDLKPPGSGESEKNLWTNTPHLTRRDEVKFVLVDRTDYEWMRDVVARHELERRAGALLASCVHGKLAPRELVEWVLADRLPVRVQLQLHKYIWGPDTTGV